MIKMQIKGLEETFKKISSDRQELTQTQARAVVKTLITELKSVTPVDTGLARDSWEVEESKNRFDIRNTTEYIQYLNEGSSQQAPAYFIEATALKYGKPLGIIVQVTGK